MLNQVKRHGENCARLLTWERGDNPETRAANQIQSGTERSLGFVGLHLTMWFRGSPHQVPLQGRLQGRASTRPAGLGPEGLPLGRQAAQTRLQTKCDLCMLSGTICSSPGTQWKGESLLRGSGLTGQCHKQTPSSAWHHFVNTLLINLTNYQETLPGWASIISQLSFN